MKLLNFVQTLLESVASDEAHALNLTYGGHSYWKDAAGQTVAQTVDGKLVKYDPTADPSNAKSVYMSHTAADDVHTNQTAPFASWADAPEPPQKEKPKWSPHAEAEGAAKWKDIPGTNPNIKEPPMETGGMRPAAGVIIMEPDGRVWIVEPSQHFGGYEHTFPKGGQEKGLSLQETAIKEAYEESGLQVQLTDFLGDFVRTTSVGRYYLAQRTGGNPKDHGWETNSVKLVPVDQLADYFNTKEDHEVLTALQEKLANPEGYVPKGPDPKKIEAYKKWQEEQRIQREKDKEKAKQYAASHHGRAEKDPHQGSFWSKFSQKQKEKGYAGMKDKDAPKEKQEPADNAAAHAIMAKKIGGQKGTNSGGFFEGADGKERYVKFYKDPARAHSEMLACNIYSELGLGAPNTQTFNANGKTGFASELIGGETLQSTGIDKDLANKILDGFAADVLTSNWDAIGLEDDNILVDEHDNVYRIDNGGCFMFRAMESSGRKEEKFLYGISEWDVFPTKNASYARVFKTAGVNGPDALGPRVIAQIQKIKDFHDKMGGWDKYIELTVPDMDPKDKQIAAKMLTTRTALLWKKAKELQGQTS